MRAIRERTAPMFPVPTIMDKKSPRHTRPPAPEMARSASAEPQKRNKRNKRKNFANFVENR
jgi:hypothetical protein